jgi:hypothetical protein
VAYLGSSRRSRRRLVEKARRGRAYQCPALPDGTRANAGQRLADALTAICQDSLTDPTRPEDSGTSIAVFVDRNSLVTDTAASGVEVESGPPVGRMALDELLWAGSVTRIAVDGDEPKAIGRASRAIPPAVGETEDRGLAPVNPALAPRSTLGHGPPARPRTRLRAGHVRRRDPRRLRS